MSLPEIIPSNLPQFVQNKNRSAFANSVIPSGSVLLFAESDGNGGSKLIAKNPDGSFTEVGGGESTSFYKCASVGTGTWTGYLATINPVTGVWSFASSATTGLTYDRLTPVVGRVYAGESCLFQVIYFNDGDYVQISPTDASSNTFGSWTFTASTRDTMAYYAFNADPSIRWLSADYQYLPQWCQAKSSDQLSVSKVSFSSMEGSTHSAKKVSLFSLDASGEAAKITTIDNLEYNIDIDGTSHDFIFDIPLICYGIRLTVDRSLQHYSDNQQGYGSLKYIQIFSKEGDL